VKPSDNPRGLRKVAPRTVPEILRGKDSRDSNLHLFRQLPCSKSVLVSNDATTQKAPALLRVRLSDHKVEHVLTPENIRRASQHGALKVMAGREELPILGR